MILIYKLWEYLMEIRDEHFKRMILISMQILYELFFILEFYMHGNFIEILLKFYLKSWMSKAFSQGMLKNFLFLYELY